MTWRFRKSFSPLPGVRLTLSPSGISTSVGVGPFRVTAGPRGSSFHANIPGTGLSFRQSRSGDSPKHLSAPPQDLGTQFPHFVPTALEAIESVGSVALTTPGLTEFKRLLEHAKREHDEITRELSHWRTQEKRDIGTFTSWEQGFLLRRVFKAKFQRLRDTAEETSLHRAELEEQEILARLQTHLDLPDLVTHAFHRLCDEFSRVMQAQLIWDTVGHRRADRIAERTTASRVVARQPVKFRLGKCDLIDSEWNVPHLENANGGDIYFYPAFALYFITNESFALLEYKDVLLTFSPVRFIEEEPIPSDSKVVDHTWAKANKDGSPDRRFNDNYQIPVAEYGRLLIQSTTGMNEEYMVSNVESAKVFATAWQSLVNAINFGA